MRKVLGIAISISLLVPLAASAAPAAAVPGTSQSATTGSSLEGLSVGGFVGYETDSPASGFGLRVDGELPYRALSPQINLSWVGSLGYTRLSIDSYGDTFAFNLLKLVPAARFTLPVNQQLGVFGDAGLGLYRASWEVNLPDYNPYTGAMTTTKVSDSEVGIMMRLGAGAFYQLNEKTRIGAMVEYDPTFGDYGLKPFSIQGGAMFKL